MFDDLLKFLGPVGPPAISAAAVFAFFEFAEKVASKPAKATLTDYLRSLQTQDAVVLPAGARALFVRVFGERQFTFRCVVRSIIFSLAAVAVISITSFPNRVTLGKLVAIDSFTRIYLLIWLPISLIPDFLNIYKTRIATEILERDSPPSNLDNYSHIFVRFYFRCCAILAFLKDYNCDDPSFL